MKYEPLYEQIYNEKLQIHIHNGGIPNHYTAPTIPHYHQIASSKRTRFSLRTHCLKKQKGIKKNTLYRESKPILITLKVLGVFPYGMSDKGDLTFKFLSPVVLYSVILQLIITVGALLRMHQIIESIMTEGPFESRVWVYLGVLTYLHRIVLVPFVHWPEVYKKVNFLNEWVTFQTEFSLVTGTVLNLRLKKKSWVAIVSITTYIIVQGSSVLYRQSVYQLFWLAPLFLSSIFFVHFMVVPWAMFCSALKTATKSVGDNMELDISACGFEHGDRLARYRELWLQLNRLTRNFGHSMGLTFGAHILTFFTAQVLFIYYFFSTLSSEPSASDLAVKWVLPIIFTVYILGVCNAAHTVTKEIGTKFQDRLQMLEVKYPTTDPQAENEIMRFYNVLRRHPPVISLCGFASVNRGLQTALMSALVTYMVVLIQFKMGTIEVTPFDCANVSLVEFK